MYRLAWIYKLDNKIGATTYRYCYKEAVSLRDFHNNKQHKDDRINYYIQMKVKDLTPNTIIINSEGKGILTVTEVRYLEHNTYAISFYGISEVSLLDGDTEVTVL